jgi:hypothetical protein
MPNWERIIRKKLRVLWVCSPEVTEELATHLEDRYEALRCEGLPEEVAFQHSIDQIEDACWLWLAMRFLQEELMTGFVPKVALPGLLTSAAASFLYWTFALDHIRSNIVWVWLVGGQLPLWWWYLLPICGVLGALLSQRNGESRLQRIAASLLPSWTMGTLILLFFIVGFTLSGSVNHHWWVSDRLESMGLVPPGFVVIPAVFSLLGCGIAEVGTKKVRRLA